MAAPCTPSVAHGARPSAFPPLHPPKSHITGKHVGMVRPGLSYDDQGDTNDDGGADCTDSREHICAAGRPAGQTDLTRITAPGRAVPRSPARSCAGTVINVTSLICLLLSLVPGLTRSRSTPKLPSVAAMLGCRPREAAAGCSWLLLVQCVPVPMPVFRLKAPTATGRRTEGAGRPVHRLPTAQCIRPQANCKPYGQRSGLGKRHVGGGDERKERRNS